MKPILCFGVTPVWQRTLAVDQLEAGAVIRVRKVAESSGGKALNAARALAALGAEVVVTGLNGGASGTQVVKHLKSYGIDTRHLTTMRATTRICTTLIDNATGKVTELVEEAPDPGSGALRRFTNSGLKLILDSSMLVICGTLPPFAADDLYLPFAKAARKAGVPLVIDSHRAALLNILVEGPLVVKMNVQELERTLQAELGQEPQLLDGMRYLQALGAQSVVVTNGIRGVYLLTRQKRVVRLTPPATNRRLNPVGSGDCMTAGIAYKLTRGVGIREAVAFGMACGSANVETFTAAEIEPSRVKELFRAMNARV